MGRLPLALAAAAALAAALAAFVGSGSEVGLVAPPDREPPAPVEPPPAPPLRPAPEGGPPRAPSAPALPDPFAALRGLPGPWFETETRRFRVLSGLSRERTAPLLDALEGVANFLARTHGEVPGGPRISVVLARPVTEAGGFADVVKALGLALPFPTTGLYLPGRDTVLAGDSEHLLSTLLHEVFHAYARRRAPGRDLPPWFNEGHATYYGTADWNGLDVRFRDHHQAAFAALKGALVRGLWIPLDRLLHLTPDEFYAPGVAPVAYLESYALVFALSHLASPEARLLLLQERKKWFNPPAAPDPLEASESVAEAELLKLVWNASVEGFPDLESRLRALAPDASLVPEDAWHALASAARGPVGSEEEGLPGSREARAALRSQLRALLTETLRFRGETASGVRDLGAHALARAQEWESLRGSAGWPEVSDVLEENPAEIPVGAIDGWLQQKWLRDLLKELPRAPAQEPDSPVEIAGRLLHLLGVGLATHSGWLDGARREERRLSDCPPELFLLTGAVRVARADRILIPSGRLAALLRSAQDPKAIERPADARRMADIVGRLCQEGEASALVAARGLLSRLPTAEAQVELARRLLGTAEDANARKVLWAGSRVPPVASRAIHALARTTPEGPERVQLRELGTSELPAVRAAVLLELDGLDPALVENATADPDPGVRASALYALGTFPGRRPEGRLLRALREETGLPRLGAAASLLLLLGP